jgi:glycosyltransferase involved in cell wall biosynthesis
VTTAVCTIVTNRELAHARVLMDSVRAHHPEWLRVALLADRAGGCFDPAGEAFQVLEVRHVPLPDKQGTLFYYPPRDLEAALKPWLFRWLFDTRGVDRVIFLDARCWVLSELSALVRALDAGAPIVLTPHLLGSLPDHARPSEIDVLSWGVHDGAVVAMAREAGVSMEMLAWWQDRAYRHALRKPQQGLWGDQRWFDLAAGTWPVFTLRDPGYNVAYWNLPERPVTTDGTGYFARDRPLALFQFEDFDPDRPERLSATDERHGSLLPPAVKELSSAYATALLQAGHRSCTTFPYAYDRFASGERVSDVARSLYQSSRAVRDECGDDPFAAGPGPFNAPVGAERYVTRLMEEIWRSRADLQCAFPRLETEDGHRFAEWFVASAGREYGLGPEHLDAVRAALRARAPDGAGTPEQHEPHATTALAVTPQRNGAPSAARARLPGIVRKLGSRLEAVRVVQNIASAGARALARSPAPTPSFDVLNRGLGPARQRIGLNICGYVTADLGIGQSARGAALAAKAAAIPHVLVDFAVGTMSPKTDRTYARELAADNPHPVNLVHVNADQFPTFRRAMGPEVFAGKYTIGYWHWELPDFPDRWLTSFDGVDEVWTPTRFVQGAVSAKANVPVVLMPHAISLPPVNPSRARFELPPDTFLFLTMYDLLSYQERKNPRAAIRAFREAFGKRGGATLVIKVLNADKCPDDMARLRESLADLSSVVLLTSTLPRQAVYDLEATCDAFVSLHRSEGFGLGLAECMYLGKPVIATNWSGNVDFMTSRNSCPVEYELVTLDRSHGPYDAGQRWAEADADGAARYMRALVNDPAYAARIGHEARQTMLTEYSPQAIGKRYQDRLQVLSPSLPKTARLVSVPSR